MLLKLSHGKEDFLKEVVESLANKSGSSTLFDHLFKSGVSRERSFLGTDDIGNVNTQAPVQVELHKYDVGKRCYSPKLSINMTVCTRGSSRNTSYCSKRQIAILAVQCCPDM